MNGIEAVDLHSLGQRDVVEVAQQSPQHGLINMASTVRCLT